MPHVAPCGAHPAVLVVSVASLLLSCMPAVYAGTTCYCQCSVSGNQWESVDESDESSDGACIEYCAQSIAIFEDCPKEYQVSYVPGWSTAAVVGVCVGVVVGLLLLCCLCVCCCRRRSIRNNNSIMVQNTLTSDRAPAHAIPGHQPQIIYVQAPPQQPFPYAYPPPYSGQGYTLGAPPQTWYGATPTPGDQAPTAPPRTPQKPQTRADAFNPNADAARTG
jgi:hypothetical protein